MGRRTPSVIERLYEQQDGRCAYTGERMILHPHRSNHPLAATKDHVLPRSLGGVSYAWNLVACTRESNGRKGSILLIDYLSQITNGHPEIHPMYHHPMIKHTGIPKKQKGNRYYQYCLAL